MKKIFILALSALLVAAFSGAAMAKVNLSGAIWATYWAQQEGSINKQLGNGSAFVDVASNLDMNLTAGAAYGAEATGSKKTFLVGQSRSGNGNSVKANAGDGFLLALDCPVNDWVKAYGEVDVFNAGNLALQQGYINLAFMKELNLRTGLMEVPFGAEHNTRPTVGNEEVFVSDYSQSANGVLQRRYDVGVQALGTLANGMVDYNVFMGNGDVPTVCGVATAQTPDNNDAKNVGVNLLFKPFTGASIGGSYFAGDYNNGLPLLSSRAKATAYDVNAGYEYGSIFAVSAEYARTRHDRQSGAYQLGLSPQAATTLVQNKVNEYVIKAIYTGIADWELGVRYAAVDPSNVEAEIAAGYSFEKKVSFAAGYKFARAAFLKAEYSWLRTNYDFTSQLLPTLARVRQNPTEDVDDNILALSLGLQF